MEFKYQDHQLKFSIIVINENNEEWHFNDIGTIFRKEKIKILEQLIKQLKGENYA